MPDTENCGRIPRKIPKTWSAEVVVGGYLGLLMSPVTDSLMNSLANHIPQDRIAQDTISLDTQGHGSRFLHELTS